MAVTELQFKGVKFTGMRQEVSVLLKKAIFDGTFAPGEQIYEAEVAKQLQLSRGPIREALLQLEKESLVTYIFNRGWFVVKLTPEQMAEIRQVRGVLEVVALRLAKERATPRQLDALTRLQEKMLLALEQNKIEEAIQLDFEFHRELWECAGHVVLRETLVKVTTPFFAFAKMSRIWNQVALDEFRRKLEQHQSLIDFVAGKLAESAEDCVGNHFRSTETNENWDALLKLLARDATTK